MARLPNRHLAPRMKTRPIDIADIKAKFGPAKQTPKRVGDLSLRLVREFQCPRCEIDDNRRSLLVPIQKPSSGGILRCYFCGEDFPIPDPQ
jgi:transcription elongation factor Elf1